MLDPADPKIRLWHHLTGEDFRTMDRANTVVLVPCSPLEVHGPHLPTFTDICEANGIGARLAAKVRAERPELGFVFMPPVWMASDVLPHAGSVQFSPQTVTRITEELGRSLAKQGFGHIWLLSFHGGPRHFLAMELGAERANQRYGARMVSVFSMMLGLLADHAGGGELSQALGHLPGMTPERLEGDQHAGAIETSLMLLLRPDLVREGWRGLPHRSLQHERDALKLPPLKPDAGSPLAMLRLFREQLRFYHRETYSGDPALSSAALGAEILDILATHTATELVKVLDGQRALDTCHSPVWPMRRLMLNPLLGEVFERWIVRRPNPVF
jgi:creatinine amidohydrolase